MSGVGAWIRYGGPISREQVELAVQRYRVAMIQPWELEVAAELKERRPDMTVLAYKCLSSARDYEPGPLFSSGVSYAQAQEHDWFAHRLDGSRIPWSGYDGHWQLRPWSESYRARWTQNVVAEIASGPFDGVMADNDVFDDYYGLGLPLADVADIQDIRAGLGSLVAAAGRALNGEGKILVPNIAESRREPGRWAAHAAYGGGFDECWLGWRHDRLFDPITAQAQISQADGPGISILRVPSDGDDDHPNVDYGLAAFWVFGGGQGAYAATGHDEYSLTQHRDAFDWDLGAPLGPAKQTRHVWSRHFEAGWAAVNLNESGTAARRMRIKPGLIDKAGRSMPRSLQLAPTRGVMLRSAAPA